MITRANNSNDNRRRYVEHCHDLKQVVEAYEAKIDSEILRRARDTFTKYYEFDLWVKTRDCCLCFDLLQFLFGFLKPVHIVIQEEDMTILDLKKKIQKMHPKLSEVKLEEIKLPSRAPLRKDLPDEANYMQDDQLLSYYELENRTFLHVHLF